MYESIPVAKFKEVAGVYMNHRVDVFVQGRAEEHSHIKFNAGLPTVRAVVSSFGP